MCATGSRSPHQRAAGGDQAPLGRSSDIESDRTFTEPVPKGTRRTIGNPLYLADLKAKELKSRLQCAVQKLGLLDVRVSFIEVGDFLSGSGPWSTFEARAVIGGRDLHRGARPGEG